MADGVSLEFPDLVDVIGRMQNLNSKVQRTVARRATLKGIRVIRDQARANAKRVDDPNTETNISKNITVQFASRQSRKEQGVAYRLGVRGGSKQYADTKENRRSSRVGTSYKTDGDKSNPGGDTYYWRFLEFGTSKMPARPILRPALREKAQDALQVAIQEALRLIAVEAQKGG